MSVEQAKYFARRTTTYQTIGILFGLGIFTYLVAKWTQGEPGSTAGAFAVPIILFRLHWHNFTKKSPIKKISGYSMRPTLEDGDLLHVVRVTDINRRELRPGDIVIIDNLRGSSLFGGKTLCKRIRSIDGTKVDVRGDNQEYSTDSRDFGPIDITDIIYKVDEVYDRYSLRDKSLERVESKEHSPGTEATLEAGNRVVKPQEDLSLNKSSSEEIKDAATNPNRQESSKHDERVEAMSQEEKEISDSADEEGLYNLYVRLIEEERVETALEMLNIATSRYPESDAFHYHRGITLSKIGDYSNAINALREAIDIEKRDGYSSAASYLATAEAYLGLEEYSQAIILLDRMIEEEDLDKENDVTLSLLYKTRGRVYGEMIDRNSAISDFSLAIKSAEQEGENEVLIECFMHRCIALSEEGRWTEAEEDSRYVAKSNSYTLSIYALSYLALCSAKNKKTTQCIEAAKLYLEKQSFFDALALGRIWDSLKEIYDTASYDDEKEMLEILRVLLRVCEDENLSNGFNYTEDMRAFLNTLMLEARSLKCSIHYSHSEYEDVLKDARIVRDLILKCGLSYSGITVIADSFLKVGYLKSAEEEINLITSPDSFDSQYYRVNGEIHLSKGELQESRASLDKSIEHAPNNYLALLLRGKVLLLNKDFQGALLDLTVAITSVYSDKRYNQYATREWKAELYALRAEAKFGLGELVLAVEDCAQSVSLDPNNQRAKDLMEQIRSESQSGEQEDHA